MSRVGQSILSSNVKSDACQSSLKCSVSWLCHKNLLKYPSQNAIIFGLLPFILPNYFGINFNPLNNCQSSLKCSVSWLCHKSLLKYPSQNAIIFGLFLPNFPNWVELITHKKTKFSFKIGCLIWWRKYCSCFVRKSKSSSY